MNDTRLPDGPPHPSWEREYQRRRRIERADATENASELRPCPFCGGRARITCRDAEGNVQPAEYEADPWSGLRYAIEHTIEGDAVGECPIAAHADDGGEVGTFLYESRDEAATAWNRIPAVDAADDSWLFAIIADIREAIGDQGRAMLSELPQAVREALAQAREGRS
jgi:hypothetical protein